MEDVYPPPPRADAAADSYAVVRAGLDAAGFSTEAICEYLRVQTIWEIFEGEFPDEFETTVPSPIAALCQTFLLGRRVPRADLNHFLGEELVKTSIDLGLLYGPSLPEDAPGTDALTGAVALYPFENGYLASDRAAPPPGVKLTKAPDIVYPAVAYGARRFVQLMPRIPCGRFLEVCAGSGPAAIVATGFADSVVAADVSERSVAFSVFNARLANADAFEGHAGSLYEGLRPGFDVIAAHPPYMPADFETETYYGGGLDGTRFLETLVRELPGQLNPGGFFYATALVPSSKEVPVLDRLRQWLGDASDSFDVLSFPSYRKSLHQIASNVAAKGGRSQNYVVQFVKKLKELGHDDYEFGAMIIRRHPSPEPPTTIRRQLVRESSWRHLAWCLDWELLLKSDDFEQRFLDSELVTRREVEVNVTNRINDEGLHPVRIQAISPVPFAMEMELQPWMLDLLHAARAPISVRRLFESLQSEGVLHAQTPLLEFASLSRIFVAGCFLECSICPLPSEAE